MKVRGAALARRVMGFTALPFVSAVAPFLLLPILARAVSPAEWAGLGIGQSLGMVGAVAVTWGWQLLGPALMAGRTRSEQQTTYAHSLAVRVVVAVVLTPLLAGLALALSPADGRLLASTMTAATCVGGLTPAWYFVGLGRSSGIAFWDVLPRVGATLLAAGLVLVGAPAVVYPVGLLVVTVGAVVAFSVRELRGVPRWTVRGTREVARTELRRGLGPTATELTLSLYTSGSVAFVGWRGSVETVAVYSSGFRLHRLATYFGTAMANGLVAWVAEQQGRARGRRMLRALQAHAVVGAVGGLLMWALLPLVSTVLFGATLAVGHATAGFLGLAFLVMSVGNSLGRHVLVLEGATNGVLLGAVAGALVGIPLTVVLSERWGATGAALALAAGQSVIALWLVPRSVRIVRRLLATSEEVPAGG